MHHQPVPDDMRTLFFWVFVVQTLIGGGAAAYFISAGEPGAWALVPPVLLGAFMAFVHRKFRETKA
jgi:hypothetical protein